MNYQLFNLWFKSKARIAQAWDRQTRKLSRPYTLEIHNIIEALNEAGIVEGDNILVHSSLSSLGHVDGGALTVILALQDVVGNDGTVIMPSFSRFEDRQGEFGQWWDPKTSNVYTGIISQLFWQQPEVLRSNHPTHAVAAWGKQTDYFTDNHCIDGDRASFWGTGAFASTSPWQKMIDTDIKCVMLGCSFNAMTLCHHIETFIVEQDRKQLNATKQTRFIDGLRHNYFNEKGVWPDINRYQAANEVIKNKQVKTTRLGKGAIQVISARDYFATVVKICNEKRVQWICPKYLTHFQSLTI